MLAQCNRGSSLVLVATGSIIPSAHSVSCQLCTIISSCLQTAQNAMSSCLGVLVTHSSPVHRLLAGSRPQSDPKPRLLTRRRVIRKRLRVHPLGTPKIVEVFAGAGRSPEPVGLGTRHRRANIPRTAMATTLTSFRAALQSCQHCFDGFSAGCRHHEDLVGGYDTGRILWVGLNPQGAGHPGDCLTLTAHEVERHVRFVEAYKHTTSDERPAVRAGMGLHERGMPSKMAAAPD